jgi:methionyl-tRNA formyltransferase
MRLVFAGTPEVALPSLDALVDSAHEVVAVLTRPDARRGRGRAVTRSPVGQRADQLGIRVLTPESLRAPDVVSLLHELQPECCPVVAYGALVPPQLLTLPRHGWVNLHFSLLPAWRGAAPVQHSVLAGDDITGASTFLLTEGLDTGPVFGTVTEPIRPRDTSGDVLGRLATTGAQLLLQTIDGLARGDLQPVAQGGDGVSVAPKLSSDDARVRWTDPALAVDRRIRACSPAPGAWTLLGHERIGLLPVTVGESDAPVLAPGVLAVSKHAVHVGTGSTSVRLGEVRPAGKSAMAAADWARGARLADAVFV